MSAKPKPRRCAIYTRKSSEEGLEQDFNSLDAQREACEAYVRSQAGEGWKLIPTYYDDGGCSGGSMDRSALRRLLADVDAHKVDTVVVYKVDRLTRSLADFAKIVDVFDARDVSFVSVTQQFNTTTSMGRLTLNMLLSFAQFEREVTGERIRDKIAASKQKGMWMGGSVPLGYEPNGRTLGIVEIEAETVRTVCHLYLEHGNVRFVKQAADRLGLTTKVRKTTSGRMRGGRPLSRGHIYRLLGNPLYIGRIPHKDVSYEGLHQAIIDDDTWNAVQAKLANNACERKQGTRAIEPSPLKGKLFDPRGTPLTPSHAVKSGRRYRYYISRDLIDQSDHASNDPGSHGWRLPAREIERIVSEAADTLLGNRAALARAARENGLAADRIPAMLSAAAHCRGDTLRFVNRVDLAPEELAIHISLGLLVGGAGLTVRHVVRSKIKRRGVEMRLVLEDAAGTIPKHNLDQTLIKAVVRARNWFDDLAAGRVCSFAEIASNESSGERYVSSLMPLAFLAPDIIDAILTGTQPSHLSAEMLIKRTQLPLDWTEQRALLGFS